MSAHLELHTRMLDAAAGQRTAFAAWISATLTLTSAQRSGDTAAIQEAEDQEFRAFLVFVAATGDLGEVLGGVEEFLGFEKSAAPKWNCECECARG